MTTTTWSDVLALVAQLDESGLEEAEVVADGVTVRVSRTTGGLGGQTAVAMPATAPVAEAPAAPSPPAVSPDVPAASPAAPAASGVEIVAPMLGVFYRRSAPDQPELVQVGDRVEPNTTVAIIEVMKMMMPVTAGVTGVVSEVVAQDGTTVEHGDVLFRVDPEGAGA